MSCELSVERRCPVKQGVVTKALSDLSPSSRKERRGLGPLLEELTSLADSFERREERKFNENGFEVWWASWLLCTLQWNESQMHRSVALWKAMCVCVCCMHVRRHAYLWGMHAETRDCCQEFSVGLHFHLFIWEQYLSVNPVLAAWLDRLASESIVSA